MDGAFKDVTNLVKEAAHSATNKIKSAATGTVASGYRTERPTNGAPTNRGHRKENQPCNTFVDQTGAAAEVTTRRHDLKEAQTGRDTEEATSEAVLAPLQQLPPAVGALSGLDSDGLHPQTSEILRQVHYYFSDGNLCQDEHLLARTGPTGTGWVSINEILGFAKMRKFKPRSQAKASLATSDILELHGKFIRRKVPLQTAPTVKPKLNPKRERDHLLVEKPWLTKGILKPTGLEEYATEGPITPAQYEEERSLFDPEEAFTTRIEYAVTRFSARKKMHQASANIFTKFMLFGGFSPNTHMFAGGLSKQEREEYDKETILLMTAKLGVSQSVVDGLSEHSSDAGTWTVDFQAMARAFLSSEFFQNFDWYDKNVLYETTNVLRKFYQYLLYHDACPEYEDDIREAVEVCSLADEEVPQLAKFEQGLPGQFNVAASTLYHGFYAQIRPADGAAEWCLPDDQIGMSDGDAWTAFAAGVTAHATLEQIKEVFGAHKEKKTLQVSTEEDIGLEVVGVELLGERAAQVYDDDRLKDTFIRRTGKLRCKSWTHPGAAPRDLPRAAQVGDRAKKFKTYVFWLEEDALRHCKPGMKLEANVSRLENGIMWLDLVENVYPSFFHWTLNERVRDWKEPGPPKDWMQRASGKQNLAENQNSVTHEMEDQMPE